MGKIFANTICSLSENFVSKIAKHKLQATLDKIRKTTGVAVDKTDISFVIEGDWDNICHAHDCLEEIYKEEVACSNAFAAVTDDVLNSPRKYTEITNVISLAENKEGKLEADAIDSCKYVGNSVTDELCNTQQETTKSSRSYMTEKCPDNKRQMNSNVTCFDVSSAGEIINKSGQCQNDDTEVCSNEIKQEITPSHKNETVNIVDSTTGMFIAEIKIKEEPHDEIELHVNSSSYPVEGQLKEEKADVSDDENNKGCYSPSSVSAERGNNTEKELDINHGSKFDCEICSKKFGTKRDMKQHLHRIHTDQGYFCTFRLSNKHLHMCKDKQDETYQPRTFSCSDQEVNFTQNIKNLNTARKNNQCARQFHRWLNEAGDTRMMWNIPPTELDKLIGSFLLSIRKADGEEYEPDTLTSYHRGIERCLREHDYPSDIVTDKEFAASRAALKSKRKELKAKGKGNKPNAAEPLSDGEEEILREKECIGTTVLMDISFEDADQDVSCNTSLDEDGGLTKQPKPTEIYVTDESSDSEETDSNTETNRNNSEAHELPRPAKRFKPTTEFYINQLKNQITEIATDKQTKWAVKLLKEWMLETGYSHSDFEWLPDEQLDNLLEQFYASAQTKSGKSYSKSALVGLRAGINRHLTLPPIKRAVNLMKDRQFHASNQVLSGLVKALKREGRSVLMDISFEDEDQDVSCNTSLDEDEGLTKQPMPAEIYVTDESSDSEETDNNTETNRNSSEAHELPRPAKRFKPTTEFDINQLKVQTTEVTTDRQTKWAVRLLKDWMLETGYSHSDFEWLPDEQLDNLLEQFYASAQTKSGKSYSKSALVGLRAGINRHLTLPPIRRVINLMKDRQFHASNQVLSGLVKALKREGKDISCHKEPIDETDIEKLYKSGVFDVDKPETLQNKVLFDIISYFGRRGREGLRNLQRDSFVLLHDAEGRKYVKMAYIEADKTYHGLDSKEKLKEPRMYENSDKFCPVKSFEIYLSKLSPKCLDLFQKPLQKVTHTSQVWYAAKALGVNTLSSFMSRISKEACLSRIYTNHCIRAYISTKLYSIGAIMSVTGPRNKNSLTSYVKPSEDERAAMSNALATLSTGHTN